MKVTLFITFLFFSTLVIGQRMDSGKKIKRETISFTAITYAIGKMREEDKAVIKQLSKSGLLKLKDFKGAVEIISNTNDTLYVPIKNKVLLKNLDVLKKMGNRVKLSGVMYKEYTFADGSPFFVIDRVINVEQ